MPATCHPTRFEETWNWQIRAVCREADPHCSTSRITNLGQTPRTGSVSPNRSVGPVP